MGAEYGGGSSLMHSETRGESVVASAVGRQRAVL
jgi:hypothetical protein